MALLYVDGFDHYAFADLLEKWTTTLVSGSGSVVSLPAANGRRGSAGLRWVTGTSSNAQGSVSRVLAPGDATIVLGMAFNPGASGTAGSAGLEIATIRDSGGAAQLSLHLNADLTLTVWRGATTASLGTTSAPVAAGAFTYVEWRALIADAGGTLDIRFNGVSVLSLTGLDTKNTAIAGWVGVSLGQVDSYLNANTGTGRTMDYDDVYVLDGTGPAPWNTFLGDCRVDARMPTGPGATAAWTPSAGANWQCVDEIPPNDDTDFTTAAAAGLTDTFVVQDAPVANAIIYGVQHCLNAKKTDAGTASIAPVMRPSGVDFVGADLAPGTAYSYLLQIAATNPATSAQWTEAGFNNCDFGYRRTT